MANESSSLQTLVLVGGGHSHAIFLSKLLKRKRAGFKIILISDDEVMAYSGALPGQIAGFYGPDEIFIRVKELALANQAQFREDKVASIDFDLKIVKTFTGCEISYDVLSLNCGARPELSHIRGAAQFAVPLKPTLDFIARYEEFLVRAQQKNSVQIVQIGGGIGGVECAVAFAKRTGELKIKSKITLLESGRELLPSHPPAVRKEVRNMLAEFGVEVIMGEKAVEMTATQLVTASGRVLSYDFAALATPAKTEAWVKELGLHHFEGFIQINEFLETSRPKVFACGDVAQNPQHPLPRAGVYAVRQADVLFENLLASLNGRELSEYRPQKDYLTLISDSHGRAIASRGQLYFHRSRAMFWLKDWIDRGFVRKLNQF